MSAAAVHFDELSSPRAGELLKSGRLPVLLLPVGAVEPHGPHAPLGTDTIISVAVCERAASALADDTAVSVSVMPPLPYGVTRYSAAFPGAIGITAGTLRDLVVDLCTAARAQGFEHAVIVNSHFEPEHVAALRAAADEADAAFLDLTRRRQVERLTEEFRSGAAHAGRYETSLVLATRPDLVDSERMRALPELPVNMAAEIAAGRNDFLAMGMTDAYCGAPADATADEGEATLATLTQMAVELIRDRVRR